MTPNDENPFLSLDKKSFPSKRKQEKKKAAAQVKNAPQPSKPAEGRAPGAPLEGEAQEEIFLQAMRGVEPLDRNRGRVVAKKAKTPRPGEQTIQPAKDEESEVAGKLADLVSGKVEFELEHSEEYIHGHVVGLDSKLMVRLKAGFYSPEAHLDMHGFNTEQAWVALVQFVRDSYMQGRRCLLLIPGRGKNSPEGYGVLRERVQLWLTQDPMKRVVLGFCTALPKHGGAGAMYVLLRKQKGKGKINWERYPVDPLPYL